MVFSSVTFLIVFLPAVLIAYYGLGGALTKSMTVKNVILLLASLVFYAWGEPVYIVLMLLSVTFNYFAGREIDEAKKNGRDRQAKNALIRAVVFNVAVLAFFKYAGFVVENVGALLHTELRVPTLPLPIGISFYTFQSMSYVIDLYRGEAGLQKKFIPFALYISFFPQLIAGPIVKYKDIALQLGHRKESLYKFSRGMTRFTVGLAKKLLFANTLGAVYSAVQAHPAGEISAMTAWLGIFCYTLQIYFDFSGYSDMAIGLGAMFGFRFNENFNYPYIAGSIRDFWTRWHISLSTWFREYVYIPLGGNRRGAGRTILNLMIVWLLTGLWHGAAWNFIFWGVFYGVLLIAERYALKDVLPRIPKPVRHVLTLIVVMLGWVFFSAPTLGEAFRYIGSMVGAGNGFADKEAVFLLGSNLLVLLPAAFCATPAYKRLLARVDQKTLDRAKVAAYPLLLLVCVIFMISETYNPFLYFRF